MNQTLLKGLLAFVLTLLVQAATAGVKIETWTAPSGARVFFVESKALPILDVEVDFPAGSAFDPPGKLGVASLSNALLDNGADGMDEDMIARKFADLGAHLGGSADLERASVTLRTLSDGDKRGPALALMAAVMRAPDYPAAVVERERQRSITGLKDALTRPDTIVTRAFTRALYANHPYGNLSTPESLARITRADLVDFHRRHYVAKRAVVTIVGNVSRLDAEMIARGLTDALPKGEGPEPLPAVGLPATTAETKLAHPAAQAHVRLGVPAMRRGDPDFFPLVVGNYVLGGGGFVSRLMQEVREKRGFAYSVYSYFVPYRDLGPFEVGLQTKREQVDEAMKVTRETLNRFLSEGPTEAELQAAKANIVGSFPLRLDSNRKILENVAVIGFYGLPLDWLDTYQAKASAVTAAQVRDAFARRIKTGNMVTVVVGPGQ